MLWPSECPSWLILGDQSTGNHRLGCRSVGAERHLLPKDPRRKEAPYEGLRTDSGGSWSGTGVDYDGGGQPPGSTEAINVWMARACSSNRWWHASGLGHSGCTWYRCEFSQRSLGSGGMGLMWNNQETGGATVHQGSSFLCHFPTRKMKESLPSWNRWSKIATACW